MRLLRTGSRNEIEALRAKAKGLKKEVGVLEKEAEVLRDQVDP